MAKAKIYVFKDGSVLSIPDERIHTAFADAVGILEIDTDDPDNAKFTARKTQRESGWWVYRSAVNGKHVIVEYNSITNRVRHTNSGQEYEPNDGDFIRYIGPGSFDD